jgi:hypothetical protein
MDSNPIVGNTPVGIIFEPTHRLFYDDFAVLFIVGKMLPFPSKLDFFMSFYWYLSFPFMTNLSSSC